MLVSYNWLNKYFDGKLPAVEKLEEALTFHAWEIEETNQVGDDTIIEVNVLPDKAAWALSHRGIAKDISVILNLPLAKDPFQHAPVLEPKTELPIDLQTDGCGYFAAARINGVKIGPSPEWLKTALESIGQRSINNIVDASNYVMFDLGQPSHAFDASKVGETGFLVRQANEGEKLVALDENEYEFSSTDMVVAAKDTDKVLSIGGIKGGLDSGINDSTADIVVEAANWDPQMIRRTATRLKLRSDASARYENGIVAKIAPYGLEAVVNLIIEVAGGELVGYNEAGSTDREVSKTDISLTKLNSVLGISLSASEVSDILNRFGYEYETKGEIFSVTEPFERTDMSIPEDLIEEIGRIHGYEDVPAVTPDPMPLEGVNKFFYYAELIRNTLLDLGWSEIYTSSFRAKDKVQLSNAFASDKGYLRSELRSNMEEVLKKNAPNSDLLGVQQIKAFELGAVFLPSAESRHLVLGVQSPSGYKAKLDDKSLNEGLSALESALGTEIEAEIKDGIAELALDKLVENLPEVTEYQSATWPEGVTYKTFSLYPAMARDIAIWVDESTSAEQVEEVLNRNAGELRVRTTLFDEFKKDGRISYAFRIVFQSNEKTLTDEEVNGVMDNVYKAVAEKGWEVR